MVDLSVLNMVTTLPTHPSIRLENFKVRRQQLPPIWWGEATIVHPCNTSNYAPHRKPTTATDINHIPHYQPLSTMQHQQPMPHYKTMMQHAPLTSFNKSSRPVEDILLNGSCDFCHCVTSLCVFCKLMYCKYKPRPCVPSYFVFCKLRQDGGADHPC